MDYWHYFHKVSSQKKVVHMDGLEFSFFSWSLLEEGWNRNSFQYKLKPFLWLDVFAVSPCLYCMQTYQDHFPLLSFSTRHAVVRMLVQDPESKSWWSFLDLVAIAPTFEMLLHDKPSLCRGSKQEVFCRTCMQWDTACRGHSLTAERH